jgi:hypothetical protein
VDHTLPLASFIVISRNLGALGSRFAGSGIITPFEKNNTCREKIQGCQCNGSVFAAGDCITARHKWPRYYRKKTPERAKNDDILYPSGIPHFPILL